MFGSPAPLEHTCGWSPNYRRTVANDECERCRAEDELILDTQRADQKKRARMYRPARARAVDRPESDVAVTRPAERSIVHRSSFVAPTFEVELDSPHLPTIPPRRID
ncbi:hypothetical protein ACFUTX_00265 [Microbacterium sp. NPDC057407]|uniref:hypothetical protein n=1 Tax=Microbacterium sp. NPDC057407 TaxID=3346120 RepID=UPI00366B246A